MLFTTAKVLAMLEDAMATTLDPAHIVVRLYSDGPAPSPDNQYSDFTWLAGTNAQTFADWTPRLYRGHPTLTSPSVAFVPGTDVTLGQTSKGVALVSDDVSPVLIGSEAFGGDQELNTVDDVLIFVISVFLDEANQIGLIELV